MKARIKTILGEAEVVLVSGSKLTIGMGQPESPCPLARLDGRQYMVKASAAKGQDGWRIEEVNVSTVIFTAPRDATVVPRIRAELAKAIVDWTSGKQDILARAEVDSIGEQLKAASSERESLLAKTSAVEHRIQDLLNKRRLALAEVVGYNARVF